MPPATTIEDSQALTGLKSPELLRRSHEVLVARSKGGIVAYPVAVLLLGMAVGVETLGWGFWGFLGILVALAAWRAALIYRFDEIYARSRVRWYRYFIANFLLTATTWSWLVAWILAVTGLTLGSMVGLIISGLIAVVALIIFSPDLLLARAFMALLVMPVCGVLILQENSVSLTLAVSSLILLLYGYGLSHQLHREFWRSLIYQRLLKARQAELSLAKEDLQQARDALKQQVLTTKASLRERQADYQRVFEGVHEAILVIEPEELTILEVNPWASTTYGYDRSQLVGLSLEAITEDVSKVRAHFEQALQGRGLHRFEAVQMHRDGQRLLLEINTSVVEYQGRPALLCLHRDLTEQRRAEELRLAKEAAEHGNEAKGQFLANMSHEIRTPMGGILGVTALLQDAELGDRERGYVRLISETAEGLLTLIDDILDFSKIEAGKLIFEKVTYDLPSMVRQVVALMTTSAQSKGLELSLDIADDVPRWVHGDGRRVRQVIMNLLGNAVKFTQEGYVAVALESSAESAAGAGRKLRVAVTDTGIGIDAAAQERLFDTFTQADETMSRRFGGTGLGLAISQRLVALMGGSLGFDSEPKMGSTFWFEIPVDVVAEPSPGAAPGLPGLPSREVEALAQGGETRRTSEPSAVDGGESEATGEARILLVEDNEVNRLVALAQLDALGYGVKAVNDGYEALEALDDGGFDLILMDCQMPSLDGYETTRRIRRRERWKELPIIALTAHAMSGDREKCLQAGMDDYISKPFRQDDLKDLLRRWLSDHGSIQR